MSTPRPSTYPNWVNSLDPTLIAQPSTGQSTTGWVAGETPPRQYMNWLFAYSNQWLMYLDESIASFTAANLAAVSVVLSTTGTVTNGSFALTALLSTTGLLVGQAITGTGIPAGTYVASISGSTVTMSQQAFGSHTETVTFSHQYATGLFTQLQLDELDAQLFIDSLATTVVLVTTGTTTTSSPNLTSLISTTGILPGQAVAGVGIPASTYVVSISGTTVVMNKNATLSNGNITFTFSHGLALGLTKQTQLDELDAYVAAIYFTNPTFIGSPTFTGTVNLAGQTNIGNTNFGTATIAGNPTFTGSPVFNGSPSFTGTITGSPTFTGNPIFTGVPEVLSASGATAPRFNFINSASGGNATIRGGSGSTSPLVGTTDASDFVIITGGSEVARYVGSGVTYIMTSNDNTVSPQVNLVQAGGGGGNATLRGGTATASPRVGTTDVSDFVVITNGVEIGRFKGTGIQYVMTSTNNTVVPQFNLLQTGGGGGNATLRGGTGTSSPMVGTTDASDFIVVTGGSEVARFKGSGVRMDMTSNNNTVAATINLFQTGGGGGNFVAKSGTVSSSPMVGTSDASDLVLVTNNTERGRIKGAGGFVFGGGGTAASQATNTAVYSGTVASGGFDLLISPGNILSVAGYSSAGVIDPNNVSLIYFLYVSATQVKVVNNLGSSQTYFAVITYQ